MEIFQNAAVLWFLLGFVFLLLEFVVPGLIIFFFAIGAWIVSLLCLFLDLSINSQLIIFLACSVGTILLFRNWVKNILSTRKHSTGILEDELLGKPAIAQTYIGPGQNGKIDFKGTSWDAASEDIIEKGENVVITGNDSILLFVKSNKTI